MLPSPDRSNQLSTAVNRGSPESPPNIVPPSPEDEEQEESDLLYADRINRYVADKVSTTPLSDGGMESPEERAQAYLNEFESTFVAKDDEVEGVDEANQVDEVDEELDEAGDEEVDEVAEEEVEEKKMDVKADNAGTKP